jgi:hypothetical protein
MVCDVCLCKHGKWEWRVPYGDANMKVWFGCKGWSDIFSTINKGAKEGK